MQKQEEALQINLCSKQKQFEALQKEIEALQKETKDPSTAALKLIHRYAPRTRNCTTFSTRPLRTYCEALDKLCVKHVLALAKSWWPTYDISLLSGINLDVPPQSFRELTDEV